MKQTKASAKKEAPKPAMPKTQLAEGPMRLRSRYRWMGEKDIHIIRLLRGGKTIEQATESLNDRFKDGSRASERTVYTRLRTSIFERHPDLKSLLERYRWAKDKDKLVIGLLKEHKTRGQIADALNERFKEGPRADEATIAHRLSSKIYKENIDFKKWSRYEWTDEKDAFVIRLMEEGKTHEQVAEHLNENFRGRPVADRWTVISRLMHVLYKKFPHLRKQRAQSAEDAKQQIEALLSRLEPQSDNDKA